MTRVYLLVGVPCSGKSWVCEQLKAKYEYISHDAHIGGDYIAAIRDRASTPTKPLLIETPFSMSEILNQLQDFDVTPVFIVEEPSTLQTRYMEREGKSFPTGHVTRQQTYIDRALTAGAFAGDSSAVLHHLQSVAARELAQRLRNDP